MIVSSTALWTQVSFVYFFLIKGGHVGEELLSPENMNQMHSRVSRGFLLDSCIDAA